MLVKLLNILSFLPLWFLYLISDLLYMITYYILSYRKSVVFANLKTCFPDKNKKEITKIAKNYYHSLCDTVVEVLKLKNMSLKQMQNMVSIDSKTLNIFQENAQILLIAHLFNWELALLLLSYYAPSSFIYKKQSNLSINNWMLNLRQRFNNKGLEMQEAAKFIRKLSKGEKATHLAILADQRPAENIPKYWVDFFDTPTAFQKGITKLVKMSQLPVSFCEIRRLKRGKYKISLKVIAQPNEFDEQQLLFLYSQYLEQAIKKNPSNWLWSHKRWKYKPKAGEIRIKGINKVGPEGLEPSTT